MRLDHEFVDYIPPGVEIREGILYISIPYGTVVHKCACGCGQEVVTPLGPTEWRLTYNGKAISLHPSVGNWSFPCRSHYWVDGSVVRWARSFTVEEVLEVRANAKEYRRRYYAPEKGKEIRSTEDRTKRRHHLKEIFKKLWKTIIGMR